MDRVLDRLYLGSSPDLDAPLRALGFSAAVDLRDASNARPIKDVLVHRLDNRDGDAWSKTQVDDAMAFIGEQIHRGRVLVACAAGMSRSASMVVGFLVRTGWSPVEAMDHVKRCRPIVAPVSAMLESVLVAVTAPAVAVAVVPGGPVRLEASR